MAPPTSRRQFLRQGATAALGLALAPNSWIRASASFDLVIRQATILDGTGGLAWRADVGIVGDTIAELGSIPAEQGSRVINADGLHLSPGFIDIHSHSDDSILAYPTADSRVRQGITTEVTGNCGYSVAPLEGPGAEALREEVEKGYGIRASWTSVTSYFELLETTGISTNHALLLGQGTLRQNAIGPEDRPLRREELESLLRAVAEGMDAGAFGLSTGLEYAPGIFTPTEEILALAHVVARRGGLYASHIRNEEASLLEAVDEAIHIGRQAGVRVEVSHLKAAGRPNWPKQAAALSLIESARRTGVEVLADAYPYTAYSTDLTVFLPSWALNGGWTELAKRLSQSPERERIRREVEQRIEVDPGDWKLIVISSVRSQENRAVVGRDMTEIAASWKVEPVEAALRLLLEEEGAVGFIGHGMSADNVELVLSHPLVMIGSDGSSMAPRGRALEAKPHPRSYGTCPRVLGHYARERGILDLPTAVKKMTAMPADQLGLSDRGRLARGKKADLVLFEAKRVVDVASFEDPHRFPVGIEHVLVNGELVVEDGRHTGARPGRVLRKA